MSDMKVIDKDGEWVINSAEFPLPDYERQSANPGTELVILQPGVPTKIVLTDYLKGQPTLKACENPMGDDAPAPRRGRATAQAAEAAE